MAKIITVQKGTKDILPTEMDSWHFIEDAANRVFSRAGFKEIRTPIFEATELFARGVGDTTDIVNKEMYTFEKSERSLTLRPENTAGVVRSYIENGMHRLPAPVKLWYKGPMFRYERPQAGRQRQFHQVGMEMFGIAQPTADVEAISLAVSYLNEIGLNHLDVEINSLGCPTCREEYKTKLKAVLKPYLQDLCPDCQKRYEKNPLRLLDCKVEDCKAIYEKPEVKEVITSEFICPECHDHFEAVKKYLDVLGIKYSVNKLLVRGLDYYNRTVFEIKSNNLGSQNAVCGGGRYDGLIEQLSGKHVPALGFAMGLERVILTMENQGCEFMENQNCELYIAPMGDTAKDKAVELASNLRTEGFLIEYDIMDRGIKAQMKYANKLNAKFVLVIGDNEIQSNSAKLKFMTTGEEFPITLDDSFYEKFSSMYMANMLSDED